MHISLEGPWQGRTWASRVVPLRWGVMAWLGMWRQGWSGGAGSTGHTSPPYLRHQRELRLPQRDMTTPSTHACMQAGVVPVCQAVPPGSCFSTGSNHLECQEMVSRAYKVAEVWAVSPACRSNARALSNGRVQRARM